MPQTRERTCGEKRRFVKRRDAAREAHRIRRTGRNAGEDGLHMRPYLCPFCGCWHLGHFSPTRGEPFTPDRTWYEIEGCPDCSARQFSQRDDLIVCERCGLAVDEVAA